MTDSILVIDDPVRPIEFEQEEFDLFFQERKGVCDKCRQDFQDEPKEMMFAAKRLRSGRIADEETCVYVCKDCWTSTFGELPEAPKGNIFDGAVEIDRIRYDETDFYYTAQGLPYFHVGTRLVINGHKENKPGRDITYSIRCGVCGLVLLGVEYTTALKGKSESNPLSPRVCKGCWNKAFQKLASAATAKVQQEEQEEEKMRKVEEKILQGGAFIFIGLPAILNTMIWVLALIAIPFLLLWQVLLWLQVM